MNWTFPSWLAGCWAVEGGIKLATAWNTSILGKNHWTSLPSSNQTWQLKTTHLYRNYRGIPHENFHICRRFPIAMFEYQRVNQIPDSSPEQPSRLWTKYRPSKVRCIRRSPSTYSNLQDRSGFQGLSRTTPPAFDVSRFYLGPFLEGLAIPPSQWATWSRLRDCFRSPVAFNDASAGSELNSNSASLHESSRISSLYGSERRPEYHKFDGVSSFFGLIIPLQIWWVTKMICLLAPIVLRECLFWCAHVQRAL